MKQRFDYSPERRREKIVERKNLEQRKVVKDKRYYVIEDEDIMEALEHTLMHEVERDE
jgi:hypothetical protein